MKASTARRIGPVCLMLGLAALTAPTFAADTGARAPNPDTLLKASQDDANWILPAKTYSGNRFTALKQIDKSIVTALSQSWRTAIADDGEQEAAPLPVGVAHADDTLTLGKESSDWHLSRVGVGSLYWAARHPKHAWRVLLPVQSDDRSQVTADLKTICTVALSVPVRVPRGPTCP